MINYKDYIYDVKDFPKEGIVFKDITPLLLNGHVFSKAVEEMAEFCKTTGAEVVFSPESRGFIFGTPISERLEIGFVPIRKKGKLPRETVSESYALEYGHDSLYVHKDCIKQGQKVVIVDDVLATGGTVEAIIKMVEKLGGIVVGICFFIELTELNGRKLTNGKPVFSLVKY